MLTKVAPALVAAAILAFTAISMAQPQLSLISLSWVRRPVEPGDVGVARLSIAAYGGDTLLNSEAVVRSYGSCQLVGVDRIPLGALAPGAARSMDIALRFTDDKLCTLSILVYYDSTARQAATGVIVNRIPGSASLSITLNPPFEPLIEVSVTPASLTLGVASNVTLTITNRRGSTVEWLELSLTPSGAAPLGAASPLRTRFGPLKAGESSVLTFQLLPLSNPVTLTITLSYVDSTGSYTERTLTYALVAGTGALLVYLEPQTLPTASTTRASIVVRNIGSDTARNATLYIWSQPGSAVSVEPAILHIGDVAPGNEARAEVEVKVPYGERGARSIPYTLTYIGSDGNLKVLRDSLSFVALEFARVEVTSIEVTPSEPAAGAIATISLTLMNLGSAPIFGVNVTLTPPQGLVPLRGVSQFLGQLSPYTPTAVPFSLRAAQPGLYTVRATITYQGYYGEKITVSRDIPVVVREAPPAANARENPRSVPWTIVIVLVVAALGFILLRRGRKRESS